MWRSSWPVVGGNPSPWNLSRTPSASPTSSLWCRCSGRSEGLSTNDREAEKVVWRDAKVAIPDIRHEVQEVFRDGDTLIGRVVVAGTLQSDFAGLQGNGRRFEIDQVLIAKIRDGKAFEIWEIADTGTLIRQVTGD